MRRDGTPCTAVVIGEQSRFCYHHDPAFEEQRKQNASRAAQAKAHRDTDLIEIKSRARDLAERVANEKMSPGHASAVAQLFNVVIRATEQLRKQREHEEFAERIEALEEAQRRRNGFRSV